MTDTTDLPRSLNEEWGFYGTMQDHAEAAWPLAVLAICEITGVSTEVARAFLDSRSGRHFADDVHSGMHHGQSLREAIDSAIQQWWEWKVRAPVAKLYGLPLGTSYLLAMVTYEGVRADPPGC